MTVFEPLVQKDVADCMVACLAMLLGISYTTALDAFPKRARVKQTGVSDSQLTRAAKRLGVVLTRVRKPNLDDVIGIMTLEREVEGAEEYHAVVVFNGSIYNPADGQVWTDIEAFCQTRRWMPMRVFVRQEETKD